MSKIVAGVSTAWLTDPRPNSVSKPFRALFIYIRSATACFSGDEHSGYWNTQRTSYSIHEETISDDPYSVASSPDPFRGPSGSHKDGKGLRGVQ